MRIVKPIMILKIPPISGKLALRRQEIMDRFLMMQATTTFSEDSVSSSYASSESLNYNRETRQSTIYGKLD